MSSNISPHLFITTNFELVNKIYYGVGKTFKSVVDLPTDNKDFIVISPDKNNNLLRFEHSFGYSGDNVSEVIIELLDVDSSMFNILANASVYPLIFKQLYDAAADSIENLPGDDNTLNSLTSEILDSVPTLSIYFMYGTSDNIQDWIGPYYSTLQEVDQVITAEGIRNFKLTFTTTSPNFWLNRAKASEDSSIGNAVDRYSRMYYYGKDGIKFYTDDVKFDYRYVLGKHFQLLLYSAIKHYLRKITTNRNTIVLLPDLEGYVEAIVKDKFEKEYNIYYSKYVNGITANGDSATFLNFIFFNFDQPSYFNLTVYQQIFKLFGIELIGGSSKDTKINVNINSRIEEKSFEEQVKNIIDNKITVLMGCDLDKTNEVYGSKTNKYTDFYIPLKQIEDGCGAVTGGVKSKLIFYEETDIRIIKLLVKHGIIEDESKPAIIFGEPSIIDRLVYMTQLNTQNGESPDESDIHQSDSQLFGKNYRTDFYDFFFLKFKGDILNNFEILDSELDFIGEDRKQLPKNAPVFRFNVANSNVTGYRNYADLTGMQALTTAIRAKRDTLIASHVLDLDVEKLNRTLSDKFRIDLYNFSPTIIVKYNLFKERDKQSAYYEIKKLISDKINEAGGNKKEVILNDLPVNEVVSYIVDLLYMVQVKNSGPYLEIKNKTGSSFTSQQARILDQLFNKVATLNLKTIPMFHLGSLAIRRIIAFFIMGKPKISGSNVFGQPSLLGTSGRYIITSFKHVISDSDVYSEFTINKKPSIDFEIPKVVASSLKNLGDEVDAAAVAELANIKIQKKNEEDRKYRESLSPMRKAVADVLDAIHKARTQ